MSEEIKKCPDYDTEIQTADDKCPHCGCSPNKKQKKSGETVGRIMLIIPVLAVIIMWLWITDMNWLRPVFFYLNLISLGTVILTSLLAYREASRLGFGEQKNEIKPIVYFIGMFLLWPIFFPLYLHQRRKKGKKNRLVIAIITAFIFSGSYLALNRFLSYGSNIAQPTDPAVLNAVHEWLSQKAIPLRAVEAGNGFDDLAPLKPLFEDVRIVGLGEATHGTREFFQFKHRMLEFLVTEMGFTVFAIEASYPGCLPIDDYVMFGKGDPEKALAGQGFWTWNTEEVRDMIGWLRRYNSQQPEDRRVHFLGVDIQRYTRAFSVIREYLSTTAPDKLADAEAAMKPLWFDQGQFKTQDDVTSLMRPRAGAGPLLDSLGAWFDEHRQQLISRSSPTGYAIVRQHVRVLQQFVFAHAFKTGDVNPRRDKGMADNVRWIFDFLGPETRMVLWAHNGHIQFGQTGWMGVHLRAAYGQAYYALGFDFNEGAFQVRGTAGADWKEPRESRVGPAPEGSVGWVFARAGQKVSSENFIVNLRDAPSQGPVATWLAAPHRMYFVGATVSPWPGGYLLPQVLGKTYDGLIFINRTTRARPTATPTDMSGIGKSD
jgi:erythromycin esterase